MAVDITERKNVEQEFINVKSLLDATGRMAKVGGWELDTNTMTVTWTDETYRIHEVPLDYEVQLDKAIDFYHPEDRERLSTVLNQALKEGEPFDVENRLLTAKGNQIWTRVICMPQTKNGKVLRLQGTFQDITERKNAEQAIRESEASLRDAQRIANIGNWSLDLKTGAVEMSDQMLNLIGLKDRNEALNVSSHEKYYTPGSWQRFNKAAETAIKTGESYEIEMEFSDKNTKFRHAIARGEAVYDKDGTIIGLKGTFQDITERKQNEKEKLRLEKQLQQSKKMESIGQLAGGIAHDFNNILYPILGFTQMSMDELPENHPVRENLQDVMDGAKRARDLVKRILLFSRQKEKKLQPVMIKSVIEESLKLLRSSIPANINLQSQFYDGEDFVFCDETEIHEIVMNLCTNAYHSMDEKGDTIRIDLNKKQPPPELMLFEDEYLCLSVSDNGPGIEQKHLQNIFEPYFTTKEVGKGSGLGLSVVHGIVKSYHGEITVESSLGKGTVFNIFLPVTDQSNISQKEKEPSNLIMGDEKILFVDDEKAIVKLVTRILEKAGFSVTGAVESSEALALFKKNPEKYDLLITDMTMPGMVGTELAQKIFEISPDIPVLMCSGYSEKLDKSKIEISNIKGYLDKPILADKLIVKVRDILDQKQE
jgi:PAS domain S-box-containing protein